MAKSKKDKDVIGRLADRGEDVLHKLTELPGGGKAVKAFNDLRERVDELGKRVRGLDELEQRLVALEARVAKLEPGSTAPKATRAAKPRPAPPSAS